MLDCDDVATTCDDVRRRCDDVATTLRRRLLNTAHELINGARAKIIAFIVCSKAQIDLLFI